METGRVKDTIKKRAILKKIRKCCPEVVSRTADSQTTELLLSQAEAVSFVTDTVLAPVRLLEEPFSDYILVQVYDILNRLYADRAKPLAMTAVIMLPEGTQETVLRFLMDCLSRVSAAEQIEISDVKAECTPDVIQAVMTLTVIGKKETQTAGAKAFLPDMEIVMAGTAALEGTVMLEQVGRELLETRFSRRFLESVRALSSKCSAAYLTELMKKEAPEAGIYCIGRSGVFGALWEIASASGKGFSVELARIPVLQETIEVCEFFDVNPYMLRSGGALLIAAQHGERLADICIREGIPAAVIGVMKNNADKMVRNGEECRYLDMPAAVKPGQNVPEGMTWIY